MNRYTPRQERAIAHYLRQHGDRLELQTSSVVVRLQSKATGLSREVDVETIEDEYDTDRKERAKERARLARANKKTGAQS